MRVLIVNSLYPPNVIGGAEISTKKLVDELARRGESVFVLTTGNNDSETDEDGVKIYHRRFHNIMSFWDFKHGNTLKRVIWKGFDYISWQNKKDILEVFDAIQPDVIHLNTIYGITPYIWRLAREYHIPIVQTLRDYNFMCPKSNLMTRKAGECSEPKMLCRLYRKGYRSLSKNVDAVTAPSAYTLNRFLKDGYFPVASSAVVYNAIDFDEDSFSEIAELRLKQRKHEKTHVIFIGSFIETKGVLTLLDAIEKCNDTIVFHFAGKGRLESEIAQMAACHKNVVLHGFLAEKNLNKLLEEMDILVCPSIWAEPFGRVIIDGYKACIPAIVSNCGGMPELVDEGLTGKIVEAGSASALANAILDLSKEKMSSERVEEIWRKLQMFSVKKQGDEFMKLYRKVSTKGETE